MGRVGEMTLKSKVQNKISHSHLKIRETNSKIMTNTAQQAFVRQWTVH